MAITYYADRVDELRIIELFVSGQGPGSQEAFEELALRIRRFLGKYLRTLLPLEQDREDVIEHVLQKLLARRQHIEIRNRGAWWVYVATIARHCAYDHMKQPPCAELDEDLSPGEVDAIGSLAELAEYRERLYAAADELWLGLDPTLTEGERKKRLLAAQLHYLHGVGWQEICAILGNGKSPDRATLNRWLQEPAVLHHLAYQSLYVDNDELVGQLLSPESPLTEKQLDKLEFAAQRSLGEPPKGWTWPEVKVVLWRYRNGLPPTKILQMDPEMAPETVEAAVAKCTALLPFTAIAAGIARALETRNVRLEPLRSPGLWKRLAFQYHAFHELPHKQILERTEPPAREAGYSLTPGMLNVWLSNGRLFQQLASFTARSGDHGK